jgi:large subunit ribosomal protein L25
MLKLKAKKRDKKTSVESLRKEGLLPGIVYGPKQEPISFYTKLADFKKLYEEAGESTIISLDIEGEEHDTLIHDVQFDPVKGLITHFDMYAIERGKKLQVSVELVFTGVAPAEKNLSAMIVKVMHEIEIECLPRNLPSKLEVSLETLTEFGSQILAKDIKLPEGVELVNDPEEVIVLAKETVEEVIEDETESPDMESIEVEQKGKGEESEGGESNSEEKSE